jgi:hypothetical protein
VPTRVVRVHEGVTRACHVLIGRIRVVLSVRRAYPQPPMLTWVIFRSRCRRPPPGTGTQGKQEARIAAIQPGTVPQDDVVPVRRSPVMRTGRCWRSASDSPEFYWGNACRTQKSSPTGWHVPHPLRHLLLVSELAVENDLLTVTRHPGLQARALLDTAEKLVALTSEARYPVQEQLRESQQRDEIARAYYLSDAA